MIRSWKVEFDTLLDRLGVMLAGAGFVLRRRGQAYRRKTAIGQDIFHIQRSLHFDGMNISADVAIRCDAIENFLFELYRGITIPGLGPEIPKGMATLGNGVGYLGPENRLQMWPVRSVEDADNVATLLFDSCVEIAEPNFFAVYNSLESIYQVLKQESKGDLSVGRLPTARKAVVAALLLNLSRTEIEDLIRCKASVLSNNERQSERFRTFLGLLQQKHPEIVEGISFPIDA